MDVMQLLRDKEAEMARLQKEIEALRIVADMMQREEGGHSRPSASPATSSSGAPPEPAGARNPKSMWP